MAGSGGELALRCWLEYLEDYSAVANISQNLLGKEAARLTDLSLQTGLLAEHELTRVLQMLRAIQTKIGITNDEDSNLADSDLEMETKLEDVLPEIERLQGREKTVPCHRQKMK